MSQRSTMLCILSDTKRRLEDTRNYLDRKLKKIKKDIIKSEKMKEKIFTLNCEIKQLGVYLEQFEQFEQCKQCKQEIQELICKCKELKENFEQILESDQSIIDINAQIKDYNNMIQCQNDYIQQLALQLGYSPEDYL